MHQDLHGDLVTTGSQTFLTNQDTPALESARLLTTSSCHVPVDTHLHWLSCTTGSLSGARLAYSVQASGVAKPGGYGPNGHPKVGHK